MKIYVIVVIGLSLSPFALAKSSRKPASVKPASAAPASSKVVEVTLFKDRAYVKRRQRVSLAKGPASVTFPDVSPMADLESIKVRVSDKKEVTVMGVRNQMVHTLKAQNPELLPFLEKEKLLNKSREEIVRKVDLLVKGNQNLTSLTDHYKDSFALNLHMSTWTRPQFQSFIGFLVAEAGKLNGEWHKLYLQHEKIVKELEFARNKIAMLRSPSDKSRLSIVVDIIADTAGTREVDIQYLVQSGGWTPTYDLRIEKNGTSKLEQSAFAWQNSGEDWENVKLTLSNIQSELSPIPPDIESYTLSYREADKVTTEVRSGKQDHQSLTVGQKDDYESPQGLAKNFVIPGLQTVRANNARTKLLIAAKAVEYAEHLELVAEQYAHVYRKGELTNPFSWDLAAGSMNIYYNGAFQQQTWLAAVAKGDEFGVNAGVDHAMKVEYGFADETEQSGMISKKQNYSRKFKTTIRNFSAKAKEIKVLKQVPVSEIEAVKVALDCKKKYTVDEELEGWLAWSLKVAPKSHEAIELKVSVTTPADFQFSW